GSQIRAVPYERGTPWEPASAIGDTNPRRILSRPCRSYEEIALSIRARAGNRRAPAGRSAPWFSPRLGTRQIQCPWGRLANHTGEPPRERAPAWVAEHIQQSRTA